MKTFGRENVTDELITIGSTGEQIQPWNYRAKDIDDNVFSGIIDEKQKTWNESVKAENVERLNPWGSIGEPETTSKTVIQAGSTSLSGLTYSGEIGMYVAVTASGLQPDWLRLTD